MFNIKGDYKIKQENKIICQGTNLITLLGESFFLRRCIDESLNPIKYIVLGNSETIPLKSDEKLGNEKIRKPCVREVDLNTKRVVLTSSFNANEIVGITEIGVSNDKILISHDTFQEITSDLLVNPIGTVEIEYSFQFTTGTIHKNWIKVPNTVNTYRTYEPSSVVGVSENDSGTGYCKIKDSVVDNAIRKVDETNYSYFYDDKTMNLYVQCYHDEQNTELETPLATDLIIQTK